MSEASRSFDPIKIIKEYEFRFVLLFVFDKFVFWWYNEIIKSKGAFDMNCMLPFDKKREYSVLFIGNSYTFFHDMPKKSGCGRVRFQRERRPPTSPETEKMVKYTTDGLDSNV